MKELYFPGLLLPISVFLFTNMTTRCESKTVKVLFLRDGALEEWELRFLPLLWLSKNLSTLCSKYESEHGGESENGSLILIKEDRRQQELLGEEGVLYFGPCTSPPWERPTG